MPVETTENKDFVVEEPNWGVLMFWEDLTYIFELIGSFFKNLLGLE